MRVLLVSIAIIHALNLPAVWLRYHDVPIRGGSYYVALFSVSSEGALPTWYSAVTLLLCAVLLGVIAAVYRGQPFRAHWSALAVIFGLMSLDEATAIHEMLTTPLHARLNTGGALFFAWVIPGLAFVAVLALAYVRFLWSLPRRTGGLFLLAGATYVAGALGMEMAAGLYVEARGYTFVYGLMATAEEVLEMGGVALFIYGLLDHLEHHVGRLEIALRP
ncbi:MAG TPA: hypothetical protein VF203_11145 [Burkholderiales bacterium]